MARKVKCTSEGRSHHSQICPARDIYVRYLRHCYQDARREKLERMGEEILDLWQQLEIGKDEQV